ncbi:MAG: C40 family peptidase [Hydrogenophaga sp.]
MYRIAALAFLAVSLLLAGCASAPSGKTRAAGAPPLSTEQSSGIAIHALGLVGAPYRYGGNTPASGFDCSGLIGYVIKAASGKAPPRTVALLAGYGTPVSADTLATGDLVFFGGSRPTHAGIFVGNGRFVHAPSTGGRVRLDRLDNPYWKRQSPSFRRP